MFAEEDMGDFHSKDAESAKLGRLLRLGSCAATELAFAFMGFDM